MHPVPAILAVLIGAIGWFYVFHSQAAERLNGVEPTPVNRRRQFNRRLGGVLLLPMAVLFLAGSYWIDPHDRPGAFLVVWFSVMALLAVVVVLAFNDLRLTAKLRRKELP